MYLIFKSFKKLLMSSLLWLFVMLLFALPLIWLNVEHSAQFQQLYHGIAQHKLFFTCLRWALIGMIFVLWPQIVELWGNQQGWTARKIIFWRTQRGSVALWLVLLELIVCKHFVLTLIHLGSSLL